MNEQHDMRTCKQTLSFASIEDMEAAKYAVAMLALSCEQADDRSLQLQYDVTQCSICAIDEALRNAGLTRNNIGGSRIGELIARYREYVQRDLAEGNAGWSGAVRSTYISYYRARRHGRRDDRQQQWRSYLKRPR